MPVTIGLVLYRCFWRVLMSILCVVVHVLCVYVSKLSGFFGTRSGSFWWRHVGNPGVYFSKIRSCKPVCAPASPAAHLCSTARIWRDINPASFCSCKLLWRSDECVLLPFFNTQRKFCSYELLCRSIESNFLPYPNLERNRFSVMKHKIRGVRAKEYVYYVNKLRHNVGLETWIWLQIVTSQRPHTRNKWPPYATEWNPHTKILYITNETHHILHYWDLSILRLRSDVQ